MQGSAVQCSAGQCSARQCSAVQGSAGQGSAVQCSAGQGSAGQLNLWDYAAQCRSAEEVEVKEEEGSRRLNKRLLELV